MTEFEKISELATKLVDTIIDFSHSLPEGEVLKVGEAKKALEIVITTVLLQNKE